MKKKTFLIAIGISLAVAVIGIVLICMSSTPYQNLSSWLEDPYDYPAGYFYARENIGTYATMYFTGIAMTVIGGVGAAIVFVKNIIAKKEKPLPEEVLSSLD